jgi:hypothetical protein
MIRLTGLVELRPIGQPVGARTVTDEALDPVGHEDSDVDNDGDVDSSDKYLKNRRSAISKNMDEDSAREKMLSTVVKWRDDKGEHEATVKSIYGNPTAYPKGSPAHRAASQAYAQFKNPNTFQPTRPAAPRPSSGFRKPSKSKDFRDDPNFTGDWDDYAGSEFDRERRSYRKYYRENLEEAVPPTPETNLENPKPSNDHEVAMANNSLDKIIQDATELKDKLGQTEKDIPAWIQDHITNAANFISQAANNYHEYNTPDEVPSPTENPSPEPMNEKAPEGWEKTVKAMKKYKDIDNPWALAYYMKSKGYKSHKKDS